MEVTVNGNATQLADGTTVADLVEATAQGHSRVAVARNGEVVPRGEWAATTVEQGDDIEMLVAVAGG